MPQPPPAFPRKGIHRHVADFIDSLPDLTGKTVVDIPCGDGRATFEFLKKGATVRPLDLFPQFMTLEDVQAEYADLMEPLPLEDGSVDYVICQEGIEHVPNQLAVLHEFNRILKPGGTLILTTPNYSHVRARLSRFFLESDYWKRMPPTEIDSIWFSEQQTDKLYFGHIFLVGVHRLQTLCTLSGFRVEQRLRTEPGKSSFVLGVLLYPLLFAVTWLCYRLYRNKNSHVPRADRERVLRERVRLNLDPATLFYKHVFWILRKEAELPEVVDSLRKMTSPD